MVIRIEREQFHTLPNMEVCEATVGYVRPLNIAEMRGSQMKFRFSIGSSFRSATLEQNENWLKMEKAGGAVWREDLVS